MVYGTTGLDTIPAIRQGMADYASTSELVWKTQNGKSRAGMRPLMIKATGLKDGQLSVTINTADAEKILAANQSANFLNQFAVVFLNENSAIRVDTVNCHLKPQRMVNKEGGR